MALEDKYLNESRIKIKREKRYSVSTSDFWYDLTDGGYISPRDLCENPSDARRIEQAIELILDFQRACEEQIEGFSQ